MNILCIAPDCPIDQTNGKTVSSTSSKGKKEVGDTSTEGGFEGVLAMMLAPQDSEKTIGLHEKMGQVRGKHSEDEFVSKFQSKRPPQQDISGIKSIKKPPFEHKEIKVEQVLRNNSHDKVKPQSDIPKSTNTENLGNTLVIQEQKPKKTFINENWSMVEAKKVSGREKEPRIPEGNSKKLQLGRQVEVSSAQVKEMVPDKPAKEIKGIVLDNKSTNIIHAKEDISRDSSKEDSDVNSQRRSSARLQDPPKLVSKSSANSANMLGEAAKASNFQEFSQVFSRISQPEIVHSIQKSNSPWGVVQQIIQNTKTFAEQGKTFMEIQLKPEFLGKVKVQLVYQDGLITAAVTTEKSLAGQILNTAMQQLRISMQDQGIRFEYLGLETATHGEAGGFQEGGSQNEKTTEFRPRWYQAAIDDGLETGDIQHENHVSGIGVDYLA
ncbi:MAG: flagellar hook-length control protein FliK [Bacillota bacterium]